MTLIHTPLLQLSATTYKGHNSYNIECPLILPRITEICNTLPSNVGLQLLLAGNNHFEEESETFVVFVQWIEIGLKRAIVRSFLVLMNTFHV